MVASPALHPGVPLTGAAAAPGPVALPLSPSMGHRTPPAPCLHHLRCASPRSPTSCFRTVYAVGPARMDSPRRAATPSPPPSLLCSAACATLADGVRPARPERPRGVEVPVDSAPRAAEEGDVSALRSQVAGLQRELQELREQFHMRDGLSAPSGRNSSTLSPALLQASDRSYLQTPTPQTGGPSVVELAWSSPATAAATAANTAPSPCEVQQHAAEAMESIKHLLANSPTRKAAMKYGIIPSPSGDVDVATTAPSNGSDAGVSTGRQDQLQQHQQRQQDQQLQQDQQQQLQRQLRQLRSPSFQQGEMTLQPDRLQRDPPPTGQWGVPPRAGGGAGFLVGGGGAGSSAATPADREHLTEVVLTRNPECREFGFMVVPERDRGMLVITWIDEEGLLARWNRTNPLHTVRQGDRITVVNGVSGDAEGLRTQLLATDSVWMRVLHVGERGAANIALA